MNSKFLLRKRTEERCYWFAIGVDASGNQTVEIYDEVVGTPTFVLPADAEILNLIRDGLEQCCFFIGPNQRSGPDETENLEAPDDPRSYMEAQKEKHARAYQPWTQEEDEELLFQWRETQDRTLLAQHFGRNPGAISSRARKLGLID